MKAWLLNGVHDLSNDVQPLKLAELPVPVPAEKEILIKVFCCGVCHTELDEIEGRTMPPYYPVIPGHQVVGEVYQHGPGARRFKTGERVGVAWINSACGVCEFCNTDRENLCPRFKATGRDANGGYAEYMVIHEDFAYRIPSLFTDPEAAPLLCAGAIGYRSLMLAGLKNGHSLGLTGFGASGHLVLKLAMHLYPGLRIFIFARSSEERKFALQLGAHWAGEGSSDPREILDAIIDTTPAWLPVVQSMHHLKPGGRLVINAIRKESRDQSALLDLRYQDHLWMEKEIKSVANITRRDVEEFLQIASEIPIRPEVEVYSFSKANEALLDLKQKHVKGAKVLQF